MCNSDLRWPRLIIPRRCAFIYDGEIKENEGGRQMRGRGREGERGMLKKTLACVPYYTHTQILDHQQEGTTMDLYIFC